MRNLSIKITTYILILVISVTSVFSVCSLTVDAGTITDLYGTGSADEIDILKLLDMALNKGGLVMSPDTIKSYLEYWWSQVSTDINVCISNADAAFTTSADFVEWLTTADIDSNWFTTILKYVKFVAAMEYETLSDYYTLLRQPDTFRQFLLSYVTDEYGNIVNTVDNKIAKYKIGKSFVDMAREAAESYIEEYEGYYLVPTTPISAISSNWFSSQTNYSNFLASVKYNMNIGVFGYHDASNLSVIVTDYTGANFIAMSEPKSLEYGNSSTYMSFKVVTDDWVTFSANSRAYSYSGGIAKFDSDSYSSSRNYNTGRYYAGCLPSSSGWGTYDISVVFTADGSSIKFWKSLESFKMYTVGKSDIYYGNDYLNYDMGADNEVTFTGAYYYNVGYSHSIIQNNIDNSETVNESTVNNIVNNYITNNYYGTDSDGNGDGDSGNNSGTGNWFTDLITGIPKLLAALVDGIAALIEAGGTLIEKIVELFTKLFVPSEGFADPIKEKVNQKFAFIDDTHTAILDVVGDFSEMGQTAPVVTFQLSKTPLANYGVGDITISFDWFEPYRTGVHLLISAIMWAVFLFRQFFGIKSLIQGTSNFVSDAM